MNVRIKQAILAYSRKIIETQKSNYLAPFTPTCDEAISYALHMMDIQNTDVLCDIGCGDGRVCVKAAILNGIKCIGIEYNTQIYERGLNLVRENKVSNLVTLLNVDFLTYNIIDTDITIIFIYLLPIGISKIKNKLLDIFNSRSIKICSFGFSIPGMKSTKIKIIHGMKLYLYQS